MQKTLRDLLAKHIGSYKREIPELPGSFLSSLSTIQTTVVTEDGKTLALTTSVSVSKDKSESYTATKVSLPIG